jgi:hypothetical protein
MQKLTEPGAYLHNLTATGGPIYVQADAGRLPLPSGHRDRI